MSISERDQIEILHGRGYDPRQIGKVLKRNHRTIARELARNTLQKTHTYDAQKAHHKAYVRRKYSTFQGRHISSVPDLEHHIIEQIKKGLSPQAISGRMKVLHKPWYASKTAIYAWLYSAHGQRYCKHLFSKRVRKKKRKKKKSKRCLIPFRTSLHARPPLLGYRHYEIDTVVSGKHTGSKYALVTLVNIRLGYSDAKRVPNLKTHTFLNALRLLLAPLKKPASLTFDNGQENRLHYRLNIPTFFCDPYSSWQKPQVENINKLIRRFIPKGADVHDYSPQFIRSMVTTLNQMPKKKLGWLTPLEVMTAHKLFHRKKIPPFPGGALRG